LGLQGHTLIFSSGDDGVAQSKKICCKNKACAPQETDYVSTDSTFLPGFPASCPWVTTVGATRIAEGARVDEDEVVAFQNQTTVVNGTTYNFEWSSGGGFSNVFDEPFYQRDALRYYYDNFKPAYTSKQ
jgi:tripeptidyl-peptidase-1